jgi:hypothetical protein
MNNELFLDRAGKHTIINFEKEMRQRGRVNVGLNSDWCVSAWEFTGNPVGILSETYVYLIDNEDDTYALVTRDWSEDARDVIDVVRTFESDVDALAWVDGRVIEYCTHHTKTVKFATMITVSAIDEDAAVDVANELLCDMMANNEPVNWEFFSESRVCDSVLANTKPTSVAACARILNRPTLLYDILTRRAAMNNELFIERVRAVIGNEPELLKLATEADATIRDLTERLVAAALRPLEKLEGDNP